ncbi:MAG: hypothetical protein GXO49_03355, partial [Chlorobi bacterium]|nr:hypothetical protein [Chlorobiota bacterium]
MKNEQLKRLKDATKSHLKEKKFVYLPEKKKGKGRIKPQKHKVGNVINLDDYYLPTPAKQILLSLAFNMAYENYRNIRKPFTKVKPIQDIADMSDMLIRYFNNKYYANIEDIHQSNLITAEQDYKYEAIDNFRKIEYTLYGTVERLRNYYSHYVHEPGILSFKDLFQNETETLTQDDFDEAKNWFQKRFDDVHRHLLTSLNNRKQKIIAEKEEQIKKFTNEKKIKNISKSYDKKIKQIDGVIKRFANLTLLDENNNLTIDGQLFIATMFLYKRQAKIILDKWRGLKDVEGYQNTLHTFFTYYSLQEKYSINNYDDNLLKFRNITSKLSTLPYSNNPQLRFIYDIIDKQNQKVYKELDRLPTGLKQKIEQLTNKLKNNKFSKYEKPYKVREKLEKAKKNKAKRDELNKMLIPVRKRNVYTQTLLQYLLDDDVIKNSDINNYQIKIAIVKTATDRLKYIKENTNFDETISLTAIKDMIKNENDEKKRQVLLNHLKELKRSFVFVTPEELKERQKPAKSIDEEGNEYIKPPEGFSFYINKNNVMIQIETSNNVSNIIIPPDLLMKWVVVHMEKEKNVWDDIYKFINGRIQKFQNVNSAKLVELYQKQYKDISLNKLLPVSIRQASKTKQMADNYLQDKTKDYINTRIKDLRNFLDENQQKAKPWKYASKRKIDVILHYLHYKLLYDVYINQIDLEGYNTSEDYIRHKFFNMNTYGIARQYFRYFGRYENNTIDKVEQKAKEFVSKTAVEQLKEDYKHLFDYIVHGIKYSKSLEDIFQWVADRQIRDLKENIHSFDQHDLSHWMKVFKINDISTPEHVDKLLDNFYVRSFALPADIISLKKIFKKEWQQFKTKKEAELQERKKTASNLKDKSYTFNYTDYAFIRDYLSNIDSPNTNIDYIFKVILDNKKQKPTVYRHLLKLKTEELVMWNIAKTYWKKAGGGDYLASQV